MGFRVVVKSVFQGNPNLTGSGEAYNFSHGLLGKGGQYKAKETLVSLFPSYIFRVWCFRVFKGETGWDFYGSIHIVDEFLTL